MAESSHLGTSNNGGGAGAISFAASTTYYGAWGGVFGTAGTTESWTQLKIRGAVTARNVRCYLSVNNRTTACTFRSRKNSANGNISISITGSTTGTFSDLSNSDTLADGDLWGYSYTTGTGSGTQNFCGATVELETSGQSRGFLQAYGGDANFSTASATRFVSGSGAALYDTTENYTKFEVRETATISLLQVRVRTNGRGTASTVRSRVNGANGNQSVSITASTTGLFEDTTNSDSLSSGDDINVSITTGTGTGNLRTSAFGMLYVGSTAGRAPISGYYSSLSTSGTGVDIYGPFYGEVSGFTTSTESKTQTPIPFAATLRNFQLTIRYNDDTAANVWRVRVGGANGNQNISVTAATTGIFTDTSNTDTVSAGDLINIFASRVVTGGRTVTASVVSMYVDGPAASGNDGALSVTLDAATLAASGALPISGGAAVTLGAASLAASGDLAISGALAAALGDATLDAAGSGAAAPIAGTLAATLAAATLAGQGRLALRGDLAAGLADASLSASGALAVSGTLAAPLDGATLAASGALAIAGGLAVTLDGAGLSASGAAGSVPISGTLDAGLAGATLAATGALAVSGALAAALADAVVSASGDLAIRGAGAAALDGAVLEASGRLRIAAAASAVLEGAGLAATGALAIAAALSATLADAGLAAAGALVVAPDRVDQSFVAAAPAAAAFTAAAPFAASFVAGAPANDNFVAAAPAVPNFIAPPPVMAAFVAAA